MLLDLPFLGGEISCFRPASMKTEGVVSAPSPLRLMIADLNRSGF